MTMAQSMHEHHYVFLRQEIVPTKTWDADGRVSERAIEDVFFCEGCLDYRRVRVRLEEPTPTHFGWRTVG